MCSRVVPVAPPVLLESMLFRAERSSSVVAKGFRQARKSSWRAWWLGQLAAGAGGPHVSIIFL